MDTRLTIRGMNCGGCVRAVARALQEVEGVEVKRVEVGAAEVGYDPALAGPERIAAAVRGAGFEVADEGRTP